MLFIREATICDAEAILNIYKDYITDSCITFETEVPSLEEFSSRIEKIIEGYPYVVCEVEGKVTGFAYASKHRERAAYKYSADVSVYVSALYQGRGIGKALYTKLFELLKNRDICMIYAGITLPNDKSISLHKSFGFEEVGIYHNVGYKFGEWLDVVWMEKAIKRKAPSS